MGKYIYPEKIQIVKLKQPRTCILKDKDNNPITHVLNYEVTITFSGLKMIRNVTDLNAAAKMIQENEKYYDPDWNDVTMGGRFSCD